MKKRLQFWTPPALALGLVIAALALPSILERRRLNADLKDANPAVRAAALRRLPHHGDVSLFIEALQDEDPDVRCVAAERLDYLGAEGAQRAKALIPLLKDDSPHVRQQAVWSLKDIGEWDRDPEARTIAKNALGR